MRYFFRLFFLVPFLISCSDESGSTIVITGSTTVAPVVSDAAMRYENMHPDVRIDVQTGGSSRGISDAQSGLADLGMISRDLKGDENESLEALRIAIDGVGVIVNATNPVVNLTREQIIKIYKGEIESWSALGGGEGEIVVANKADGRGTLEVFLKYTGLDSADINADVIVGSNQQAIKTVAGNPDAIGYVSIGAATSEMREGSPIRLVAVDGIEATAESVAAGEFPITRPLHLVFKKDRGENPSVDSFLAYLQSEAIHDIIESHLYVPAKSR